MDEMNGPGQPFQISHREVWDAWVEVKANKGTPRVNGQSIEELENDLKNNLYKIWNRMSSKTYFPPPARAPEGERHATRASLIASVALACASLLTGHGVNASRVDRPQAYAACSLHSANLAPEGWPMPSGGSDQSFNTALSHLLLRHYAQAVEALARVCGHRRLLAHRWRGQTIARSGSAPTADRGRLDGGSSARLAQERGSSGR